MASALTDARTNVRTITHKCRSQIQLAKAGLAGRILLRFSEIPEIDIELADTPDEPPLGMGECTMGPTTAAIANAAAHALGMRLRDMPLTRERIVAAITPNL
jgi:CO/xanthine dehydrogenase Mo-binding subunit